MIRAVWEKVWKGIVGNQKRDNVRREVSETQGRSKRKKWKERETPALRNKVKSEKHVRDIRGIKRRDTTENVFARPNGLREKAETAISCR